tara:strand:- start:553 stop:813 length:261 start_codon:yes stop_codon:yes gene_type:complete
MEKETTDDLTFKLLANPTKLKKKSNNEILNEEDELFLKIKKKYKGMLLFNSDKNEILNKIETILIEKTIENIVSNLVKEVEYELLL